MGRAGASAETGARRAAHRTAGAARMLRSVRRNGVAVVLRTNETEPVLRASDVHERVCDSDARADRLYRAAGAFASKTTARSLIRRQQGQSLEVAVWARYSFFVLRR